MAIRTIAHDSLLLQLCRKAQPLTFMLTLQIFSLVHRVANAPKSLWLFYQQTCNPNCPFIPGEHPYPGCSSIYDHAKCCCNAGSNNHAGPCWIQNAAPDPFPIPNLTEVLWIPSGKPFPPAAKTIIAMAGPRPRHLRPYTSLHVLVEATETSEWPHHENFIQRNRQVDLFICCDNSAEQWAQYLPILSAHRNNLTGVILSLYEMSKNGTLTNQGSHTAEGMAASVKIRALGLQTTALIAMNPSGVRKVIYDTEARARFIVSAVAVAKAADFQGFNLDAEFPNDPNSTDGSKFVEFLNEFADALHTSSVTPSLRPSKRTLSVDVHGDGTTPFDFHVWGTLYRSSRIDKVITMATYTDKEHNFDK